MSVTVESATTAVGELSLKESRRAPDWTPELTYDYMMEHEPFTTIPDPYFIEGLADEPPELLFGLAFNSVEEVFDLLMNYFKIDMPKKVKSINPYVNKHFREHCNLEEKSWVTLDRICSTEGIFILTLASSWMHDSHVDDDHVDRIEAILGQVQWKQTQLKWYIRWFPDGKPQRTDYNPPGARRPGQS